MDASILIQGLGLGAVVLATFWDMHAVEHADRTRRAVCSARDSSSEERCPFCRKEFDEELVVSRCASCGTPHHALCFFENGTCTIFGCGSEDLRPQRVPVARLVAEAEAPAEPETSERAALEAVTEAAPCG